MLFHRFLAFRRRFDHTRYQSEYTRFLNDFIAQHPEALDEQRRGWQLLWNRPADLAALKKDTLAQADAPRRRGGYVYD